jgi:uncharacterized glyoxalase superfamily protein PhnB
MNTTAVPVTARAIFPSLKYDDAPRAIDFLCNAFGFEKYAVFPGSDSTVAHAQLKLGSTFIMVGATTTDRGRLSTPAALAGALGGIYVVLERDADVDAHFARACAAGATIVSKPESSEQGGRNYTVSDCEGYVWSFTSHRAAS